MSVVLYEVTDDALKKVAESSLGDLGLRERADLQRLLKRDISPVADDLLVIGEEVSVSSDSRLRVDLLGIDEHANLVVIELKRDDPGTAELQAIRYAAMISNLTFERAVELYDKHLRANRNSEDRADSISAEQRLLEFLEWDEPDADGFGNEVRIILVASDFAEATELVTTVNWLNEYELDIRCVRMKPYSLDGRTLLDVQTLVPLPELSDYQVATREKRKSERSSRKIQRDYTKYNLTVKQRLYTRLNKRSLVYHLVSRAFEHGISADNIQQVVAAQCGERVGRWMFTKMLGEFDLDGISDQLTRDQRTRYFLDEATVWRENGNTWILTNQWGGDNPFNIAKAVRDAFPDLQIEVSKAA